MKKFVLLALSLAILCACSKKQVPAFKINGTVESAELDGKELVLAKIIDGKSIFVDTAVIKDQQFTFTGSIDKPYFCTINLPDSTALNVVAELLIEGNKDVLTVNVTTEGSVVTGCPLNDTLQQYISKSQAIYKQIIDLNSSYRNLQAVGEVAVAVEDSLQQVFYTLENESKELTKTFVRTNINNLAGITVLPRIVNALKRDELSEILKLADSATLETPLLKGINERITATESIAIGKQYVDLQLQDKNGKNVKLVDFIEKNSYTLIHFWSSTCNPCKQQVESLLKAYKKYTEHGVEFVSISFDSNQDSWLAAIETLGMSWPQLSDFLYTSSPAYQAYAIVTLPQLILVAKDGTIVARDIFTNELDATIAEHVKDKK